MKACNLPCVGRPVYWDPIAFVTSVSGPDPVATSGVQFARDEGPLAFVVNHGQWPSLIGARDYALVEVSHLKRSLAYHFRVRCKIDNLRFVHPTCNKSEFNINWVIIYVWRMRPNYNPEGKRNQNTETLAWNCF